MANLTGKQLVELGIITGPINEENIAQHGVDLELKEVREIYGAGFVPKKGKTILADRILINPKQLNPEQLVWELDPGIYDITFFQGCKIPPNQRLEIVQRSSLLRNGSILRSSVFDAGFETENIGTVLLVHNTISIEVGARVAQIIAVESNEVKNLYAGQFQGDRQRKV